MSKHQETLAKSIKKSLTEDLQIDDAFQKHLSIKRFYTFVRKFWHIIEPTTVFKEGWHIEAICLHLEAVKEFHISKLVINMPPRHMKSILCSVMFPAWVWLEFPSRRFIYCSYAESLAVRDSIKTRILISSDEYQELLRWKCQREGLKPWRLLDDNNQKKMFENTETGSRMAVGVGGGLMGQGGDYLFVDDPMNALEVTSDAAMETVNLWHDTAFSTRYNNPNQHAKVIVMQRLHENDLTGHVTENDERYERLILPAKYDPDSEIVSKTSLNYKDPRTKKGELLWPNHFNEAAIKDLEIDLNKKSDSGDAQLQQDPRPRAGALFPREHWRILEGPSPSTIIELVQFIDSAQKPGISNDYTVIATWAKTHNGYVILDVWKEKTTAPLLQAMTEQKYKQFRPHAVVIEDKSAGSSLIQYLLAETSIPVLPYNPGQRDKVVRATAATPTVKAGKVWLPKDAPWVKDFIKEHETFPKGKHDDQVDTTSMAVDYFQRTGNGDGPRIRST